MGLFESPTLRCRLVGQGLGKVHRHGNSCTFRKSHMGQIITRTEGQAGTSKEGCGSVVWTIVLLQSIAETNVRWKFVLTSRMKRKIKKKLEIKQ